jgi:hypothetical protein
MPASHDSLSRAREPVESRSREPLDLHMRDGSIPMTQTLAAAERRVTPARTALPDDAAVVTHRGRLIAGSVLAGLLVTLVWSFEFVDSTIGDNVANNVLGYDAKARPLDETGMAIVFAFVSGLAGTFTACNVAAFGALAPLSCERLRVGDALPPLAWLAAGACAVAGTYGAIGALVGSDLPQLSQAMAGEVPVRLVQSFVVFGLIGLLLMAMGLAALGVVRDPLRGVYQRDPRVQPVVMGALIGAFLIGRPFPLFHKLFEYAASTHNALVGSAAFVLQSLGNIALIGALFLVLNSAFGGAFPRWLGACPGRVTRFTAGALLTAGTFTFAYWVIRVPAAFGIGWWPSLPWN